HVVSGGPNSVRRESRVARGTRTASGHRSFSDRTLYRERCLRGNGGLAQATGSRNGRLLQSAGSRLDHPVCNRNWSGSLALATGRRCNKRQLTPAYDLCADFRIADLISHLDAVASAHQGRFAACILFCSDSTGLNGNHPDRAPRWNHQRGRTAVTSTDRSSNEFQSKGLLQKTACAGPVWCRSHTMDKTYELRLGTRMTQIGTETAEELRLATILLPEDRQPTTAALLEMPARRFLRLVGEKREDGSGSPLRAGRYE